MNSSHPGSFARAHKVLLDRNLVQGLYQDCPVLMTGVVLNLEGQVHRARRKLMAPVFSSSHAQNLEQWLDEAAIRPSIADLCAAGGGDLVAFAERIALVMALKLVGVGCTPARYGALLETIRTFGQGATSAQSLESQEALNQRVDAELKQFVVEYLNPEIAARNEGPGDALSDLLQILLAARDRGELTTDQLQRDVAFLMQASVFSTSNALVHVFHELIQSPQLTLAEMGNRQSLLPLQRAIHEALRLHPASPIMRRVAAENQHHQVEINLQEANQDSTIFGRDAERFNPRRWVADQRPFLGLTFGTGHHSCPGRVLVAGRVRTEKRSGNEVQVGLLTRVIAALGRAKLRPDESQPPVLRANTTRGVWASYPLTCQ